MKGSYNFQGFFTQESMENWYKWRLGFTFKNEVTNFLIWYTKVLFNPLKFFQKIEVTDFQKLGYYWVFVLSINVNKSEIFKQNLLVWNPQMKMLGLVWYIVIRIVCLCTSLKYDSCRKCFCCKILTLVD